MLKINEELKDKISYGLIAAIILTAVLPLVITIESRTLILTRCFFAAVLAGLYLLTSEKKDLFFLTFASFVLLSIFSFISLVADISSVKIIFALPYLLSALAFGVLAYNHSKEFKAFEMLEFLLVLFLLVTASKFILQTEYSMYYAFGTCFVISTLIYNNNLWMRYKDSEKELLIFLLVISFVDVIQVSAKYISF